MNNYRKISGKDQIILQPEERYEAGYKVLEPNIYKLWDAGNMFVGMIPMFERIREGDKLVQFKTGIVAKVMKSADKFLGDESKDAYHQLKITHKMGLIFYGKQGTGKTSTCMLIMKTLVDKHNAICLDCTGRTLSFVRECIRRMREIQDNPIVVFIDEFESSVKAEETKYLTFLDGTDSVDNLIFIGCTNYIDKIPDRIKKRKSRIKHLYNINSLPLDVYKEYLIDRIPLMETKVVAEFAFKAEEKGLTIDQLKHALIDYKLEGFTIEKSIDRASNFDAEDCNEEEENEDNDN